MKSVLVIIIDGNEVVNQNILLKILLLVPGKTNTKNKTKKNCHKDGHTFAVVFCKIPQKMIFREKVLFIYYNSCTKGNILFR